MMDDQEFAPAEEEASPGLLGSMGLRSYLPEGFEAPDVGGWIGEHPLLAGGLGLAGGAAVKTIAELAITAVIKRYLAKRARLKLQMADEARLAERAQLGHEMSNLNEVNQIARASEAGELGPLDVASMMGGPPPTEMTSMFPPVVRPTSRSRYGR